MRAARSALLLVVVTVLSSVAACSAPREEIPPPVAPAPALVASAPPPPGAPASVVAGAPAPAAPPARVPKSADECRAMVGTNEARRSDATVTPEQGSGKSERFAGIVAAIKSERGALRCCYDLWAQEHPRDAGLTLAFAIDDAGAITGIQIKGDSGDPFAMEAGACIVDVALGIQYPASPRGLTTTFEYDLGFKYRGASPR